DIRINGKESKANTKVRPGDRVTCHIPSPKPLDLKPEAIPLDIIHEDPALLIVNKPAGLVMHPAAGHDSGTLVHALLHHCRDLSGIGGRTRPGIVHRLDKDTSGLVVVAKTDQAHRFLSNCFKQHDILRTYRALVRGRLKKNRGIIELSIGRDRRDRKKISPRTQNPREAVTEFRVIDRFENTTHVEVYPKTGRTHQIRVHFASSGHPVVGDHVYGGRRGGGNFPMPSRQMLHAEVLGFKHPVNGKQLRFEAPPPRDMGELLRWLKNSAGV
ncbi:MAG TPA: RluA family pseudouridine synthase, partial [Nitrospiria bacterium]|nr:RluA family pseudouridine synthase [Nitrospiria bacterium]